MDFTVESPDFDKLEKTFLELSQMDQYKLGIAVLRKGTKPTEIQAQSNIVHDVTGNLTKSVGTLNAPNREIAVIIGARKGRGYKGWHGHLVEEGTVDRYAKTWKGKPLKKKRFTGKMDKSKPYSFWLRKVVQTTEQQSLTIAATEMYNSLIEIHKKNGL
jgi:hypothetical protein